MNEHLMYSDLGTSNKRKETRIDHIQLRRLMNQGWAAIREFYKRSPEEINEFQFKRIKELVRHAYDTVDLYRDKYSEEGFEPGDLKTWNDFQRLPILTKEELIESFPKKAISSKYGTEFTTRSSGSTGKFVTVAVSPEAIYLDTIQGARQFYFQSKGNYEPLDLALFIYTGPWWVSSIDGEYPTEFLPTTTSIEDAIKKIEDLKLKELIIETGLSSYSKESRNIGDGQALFYDKEYVFSYNLSDINLN